MTSLSQIRSTLALHKAEFYDRFSVKNLAVFGSYARNEQRSDSDVDILVEFNAPVGIEFIDLGNYLERILGLRVDLVSRNGIKPKYLDQIRDDLKYV
ncbi:MAG: nucleotidyltransferase family protein [Pyrinomonadaceae bacterium]|nr:nucleotidyltransferase family protein [Pyrinomonadaceae bacterium]MBP6213575.1 nucleotidyltransferase family protein [Pyrinomonadaceae bacterium]